MNYFTDLDFKTVIHSRRFYERDFTFQTRGYYSLELIRSGQLELSGDEGSVKLEAPMVFWLQKDRKYMVKRNVSRQETAEHLYCDFFGERGERIIRSLNAFCPAGHLVPRDPAGVAELFFELLKYYRLGKACYQPEMVVCLEKLMLKLMENTRPVLRPDDDPYHIWKMGDDIRKDPFRQFDFTKAANRAGISTDHYRRLFRAAHKQPPNGFVKSQRLIRSAELLTMTDMRIKDIVYSCGFHSMVDFSRSFKHQFGLSPRRYRIRNTWIQKNPAGDSEEEPQREE